MSIITVSYEKIIRDHYLTIDENFEFESLGEACEFVNLLPDDVENIVIKLPNGLFHERIAITHDHVHLLHEGNSSECFISYDHYAYEPYDGEEKRGTFRTATVFIDADDFTATGITFENTAGNGNKVGQALAVYADGDMLTFNNCRFKGSQDTLFTAPLPKQERQPGGFRGPKEFSPRKHGRHFYNDCYICGDVDFIFGSATALFTGCNIHSLRRETSETAVQGYITAASTYEETSTGYVFNKCRFTSECPDNSVYLGRPWRDFAKVVIMNSYLGPHIKPEGFCGWGADVPKDTTFFAEYKNEGPGAAKRPDFVHTLTSDEADELLKIFKSYIEE